MTNKERRELIQKLRNLGIREDAVSSEPSFDGYFKRLLISDVKEFYDEAVALARQAANELRDLTIDVEDLAARDI